VCGNRARRSQLNRPPRRFLVTLAAGGLAGAGSRADCNGRTSHLPAWHTLVRKGPACVARLHVVDPLRE
jgi:hypothetical protein